MQVEKEWKDARTRLKSQLKSEAYQQRIDKRLSKINADKPKMAVKWLHRRIRKNSERIRHLYLAYAFLGNKLYKTVEQEPFISPILKIEMLSENLSHLGVTNEVLMLWLEKSRYPVDALSEVLLRSQKKIRIYQPSPHFLELHANFNK